MRLSLKPLRPPHAAAAAGVQWRYFSDAANRPVPPSPSPLPSTESSSVIYQILSLLRSTDPSSWSTDPTLDNILSTLSPPSVLTVTRHLQNSENALNFFNYLKSKSAYSDSAPLAFQSVLEHTSRENPDSPAKMYELFLLAKGQSTALSIDSATLLIRCFGKAKMMDEMMAVFDAIDGKLKNTDIMNLVILGQLKSSRVDDALKLLGEMFEPDSRCPPNRNTTGIVFSSILKRTWHGRNLADDEIYNLFSRFGEHGVSPNGFLLTLIIARFCRNLEYDKAWNALHEAMNLGSDIESASYNALLDRLGQNGDFERINLLMKEMQEKGVLIGVVTYGIVIKHLCRFQRVDDALEVLEQMKDGEIGIEPDIVIYNTVIDGLCKVGRQEEGLKLMERMKTKSNCHPGTITYNCLIGGFCKAGEIEKGHELFEQMSEDGIEQNVITYNSLISGMCRHGRVGSAMELFSSMKDKGLKCNAVTYTVLITAFCSVNNIGKALQLFDDMQGNGCSADAVLYYSLISGLSRAGRMNDAYSIVSKMKEAGFPLDIGCYNTLIGGFCSRNKLDKALEMLKDMNKDGVQPDQVTYNTLLSHYCSKGDFTHAERVMRTMAENGLKPNVVAYGTLIQGYCWNNNLVEAMKIFRDMNSSSTVQPNTVIYNLLIDSFCKNDEVDEALSLLDNMKEKGLKPNATTYNALFKGLQHRNWFEKALELMDQMTEEACYPDFITMETLTPWLSAVGEGEKLRKFVKGNMGTIQRT